MADSDTKVRKDEAETPEATSVASTLSPEQKRLVEAWFDEKVRPHHSRCPLCNTDDWAVLSDFVTAPGYAPAHGLLFGGRNYPHFMLACTNCGNVQFINAIQAGLLKKDK